MLAKKVQKLARVSKCSKRKNTSKHTLKLNKTTSTIFHQRLKNLLQKRTSSSKTFIAKISTFEKVLGIFAVHFATFLNEGRRFFGRIFGGLLFRAGAVALQGGEV